MNKPPIRGKLRFFGPTVAFQTAVPSWISNIVYGPDRSITEWSHLIQNYKQHAFSFPFIRQYITTLDAMVTNEMRIRWLVQKFVRNLRIRLFARRVIGAIDLYTMSNVPADSQVCVYDYPSKSVYIFHTQTAIRILESALKHSTYGIPMPHMPRNPYTNLSFTDAQTISIMSQIGMNCSRVHRFPPLRLLSFRGCKYDIQNFKHTNRHKLNMEAAIACVHAFHDPTSIDIYMEVLDDTVDLETLHMPRWNVIRGFVRNRTMSPELLTRFDALVLSLFLYLNHSICYTFASYTAMLDELENVYKAADEWWKTLPRRIQPRIGPTAFASGPQNVLHP